ncbi:MAG: transcription antitermination factor NusB [Ruminococcus sp.]|nr:transcription antitermination factor NusB [Ruminococcus sp.]
MTRSEIREQAFILVFESLFRENEIDEIIELAKETEEFEINSDVIGLFKGTVENLGGATETIAKYSEKRQVGRIPKVNLAVLALAIYEIEHTDIPINAAISEAVNLSKKYTYENDVSFVNGVLGAYARDKENV